MAAEIVDVLGDFDAFGWFNGPAGMQLGTGPTVCQIACLRLILNSVLSLEINRLTRFFSAMLEGPDDGKVSVASTKLEGMKAHITLPVTHTFMMNNFRVMAQAILFLENGAFDPDLDWRDVVSTAIQELADRDETR